MNVLHVRVDEYVHIPRRPEGPSERASAERRLSIYRYRKIDEREEEEGRRRHGSARKEDLADQAGKGGPAFSVVRDGSRVALPYLKPIAPL